MKKLKFAFAGFRHSHAKLMYEAIRNMADTEIVACYEQDSQTIEKLHQETPIRIQYKDYEKMLAQTDCDVVVIGDYYNIRGQLAIKAMEQGKHILSDKPLCTSLEELDRIRKLSLEKNLSVGCMFTLRDFGVYRTLKDILASGQIGQVQSMVILGLHPLNLQGRPAWYRDKTYYCGVLNDLGPHCFDLIEWICGISVKKISYARVWNGKAKDYPDFQDCGQFAAVCENHAGILCDISYLAPEKLAYRLPQMWRVTCYGQKGMAETALCWDKVLLACDQDDQPQEIPAQTSVPHCYLKDFLKQIQGIKQQDMLTTQAVLNATEWAIQAQKKASE